MSNTEFECPLHNMADTMHFIAFPFSFRLAPGFPERFQLLRLNDFGLNGVCVHLLLFVVKYSRVWNMFVSVHYDSKSIIAYFIDNAVKCVFLSSCSSLFAYFGKFFTFLTKTIQTVRNGSVKRRETSYRNKLINPCFSYLQHVRCYNFLVGMSNPGKYSFQLIIQVSSKLNVIFLYFL